MTKIFKLAILVVMLLSVFVTQSPVQAQEPQPAGWVRVMNQTYRETFVRAADKNCEWSRFGMWQVTINPPGDCGRSVASTNYLWIYGHNPACDREENGTPRMCHYYRDALGIMSWGSLVRGDAIEIEYNGALYRGKVMEVFHDAGKYGVSPDADFYCPDLYICGSLITSADIVPAYVKVTFQVKLVRSLSYFIIRNVNL